MATLRERIEAAQKRAEEAAKKVEELKAKEAEGPKRQKSRDITQVREIILLEGQLRKKYGCGYSGLAEITRKAKKDGVEPVVATGQSAGVRPFPEGPGGGPVPPPPQQHPEPSLAPPPSDEEFAGASEIASAAQTYDGPPTATEFDENDEPPVENTPELAAAQRDDLPWDDQDW